ncbi:MAG: hypothetical protein SFZ03_00935 [Candidatus Melainabacteria bacterium]|nr:hypothetical protein [Candidatus Melainabacteria bacterium]
MSLQSLSSATVPAPVPVSLRFGSPESFYARVNRDQKFMSSLQQIAQFTAEMTVRSTYSGSAESWLRLMDQYQTHVHNSQTDLDNRGALGQMMGDGFSQFLKSRGLSDSDIDQFAQAGLNRAGLKSTPNMSTREKFRLTSQFWHHEFQESQGNTYGVETPYEQLLELSVETSADLMQYFKSSPSLQNIYRRYFEGKRITPENIGSLIEQAFNEIDNPTNNTRGSTPQGLRFSGYTPPVSLPWYNHNQMSALSKCALAVAICTPASAVPGVGEVVQLMVNDKLFKSLRNTFALNMKQETEHLKPILDAANAIVLAEKTIGYFSMHKFVTLGLTGAITGAAGEGVGALLMCAQLAAYRKDFYAQVNSAKDIELISSPKHSEQVFKYSEDLQKRLQTLREQGKKLTVPWYVSGLGSVGQIGTNVQTMIGDHTKAVLGCVNSVKDWVVGLFK